jgi:Fur family ferric uptake transcriptional regulator
MRASSVEQVILEVLAKGQAHLTALQVYERIRERLPAVNPSTVYRALERLAVQGRVSVSDMGTGAAVYEVTGNALHHHLVCRECGYVETIGHEEVAAFFTGMQQQHQFEIVTNHLILFGVCAGCQKSAQKKGLE